MFNIDKSILSLITKWDGWGLALFTLIAILITGFLSSLIGIEREIKGQAAGLRTHVIVSIGCCILMVISVFAMQLSLKGSSSNSEGNYNLSLDVSRIAAGILSGIGFMGAGAIVKQGLSIRGLTTAATLWLVSAIGMAVGCGFVVEAVIVTIVSLLLLNGLSHVERLIDKAAPQVYLSVAPNIPILHEIRLNADKYRLVIKNIVTENGKGPDGRNQVDIIVFFAYNSDAACISDFIDSFSSYPYVYKVFDSREKHQK